MAVDAKAQKLVDLMYAAGIQPDGAADVLRRNAAAGVRERRKVAAPVVSAGNRGVIPFADAELGQDGGPSVMGRIGGALLQGLDVIDTPRAAVVSGVKELSDTIYGSRVGEGLDSLFGTSDEERQANLDRMGTGSWQDFKDQTWRNAGSQELLLGNQPGGWQRSVAGFGLDVLLDPTAWVTAGATSVGGKVAKNALETAVNTGSRKSIARELGAAATREGLQDSAAVQKLVAESFSRGRGALTPRGLKAAGVSADEAARLGVPQMQRLIGVGKNKAVIPGTRRLTNAAEDMKGSFKSALGSGKGADWWRAIRITDEAGERAFTNAARTLSNSTAKRFEGAMGAASSATTRRVARGIVNDEVKVVARTLGPRLRKLSATTGPEVTDAIERGVFDADPSGLAPEIRDFFGRMKAKMESVGVVLGDRGETYVPHIVSREARLAARENPELAKIVTSLNTKESFQGQRLMEGTIREINEKSVAEHGVKLLEDDVRDLIGGYMHQAERAMSRSVQAQELKRLGVADDLVEATMLRDFDEVEQKLLADYQTKLKATRSEQKVSLRDGRTVRRRQAAEARKQIVAKRSSLAAKISSRQHELNSMLVERGERAAKLQVSERKLQAATAARDTWLQAAKRERGNALRRARAKVAALDAEIVEHNKAIQSLKDDLDMTVPTVIPDGPTGVVRAAAASNRVVRSKRQRLGARILTAQEELAGLTDEYTALGGQHEALKVARTPLGSDPSIAGDAEKMLIGKQKNMDRLERSIGKQSAVIDNAALTFDAVAADKATTVARLQKYDDILADMERRAGGAKDVGKGKINVVKAQELKDELDEIMRVLNVSNDPVRETLAKLDAQAVIHDIEAARLGERAAGIEEILATLNDPRFREYSVRQTIQGYSEIPGGLQVPTWMDDALKMERVINDPKWQNAFVNGVRQFRGLWKAYALARPGFLGRNAYSSTFGFFLEAGPSATKSYTKYVQFQKMVQDNPTDYMEKAAAKWGDDVAEQLDQARQVVAGSGGGLAPNEVQMDALEGASINPLKQTFVPLRVAAKGNETFEHSVRGAHAFNVIQRGGSPESALDVVEKWQFNYRDLTKTDEFMRNTLVPFWTFWSKNMALQAEVWAKHPDRLNRTYFNAMRNIGYGDSDVDQPDYYSKDFALRLSGDAAGKVKYLFPDLPSFQFISDMDSLTSGEAPNKILSQMGPWIKSPVEMFTGENLFTGYPYANSFSQKDSVGNNIGRKAPVWAEIPGVEQLLTGTGLAARGGRSGDLLMKDKVEAQVENLLPPFSQLDRLFPTRESDASKADQNRWAWLTGLSFRENTPEMRARKRLFDDRDAANEERISRVLAGL